MRFLTLITAFVLFSVTLAAAQDVPPQPIFDDKMLLNGYSQKYSSESKDILMAMLEDEHLNPYKTAAAVRVFRQNYSQEVVSREKRIFEKTLLRRLSRSDSPFVETEIMHTLCVMDRYRYFKSMVPPLIKKLDHYNRTVNEMAHRALNEIIESGNNRPREARIVFHTLRKILFLSRNRLEKVDKPDDRLKRKLDLLRWSIKILGTEELKHLPKEVLNLM